MPVFASSTYDKGLAVHVASGCRNERSMTAGLKTLAYTDAVAGLLEARRAGADEALFLDTEGHCSEATASNLFVWTGSLLLTPPISCGVLPGITREAVLELAQAQGLDSSGARLWAGRATRGGGGFSYELVARPCAGRPRGHGHDRSGYTWPDHRPPGDRVPALVDRECAHERVVHASGFSVLGSCSRFGPELTEP